MSPRSLIVLTISATVCLIAAPPRISCSSIRDITSTRVCECAEICEECAIDCERLGDMEKPLWPPSHHDASVFHRDVYSDVHDGGSLCERLSKFQSSLMAGLMAAPMVLIELALMRSMTRTSGLPECSQASQQLLCCCSLSASEPRRRSEMCSSSNQ